MINRTGGVGVMVVAVGEVAGLVIVADTTDTNTMDNTDTTGIADTTGTTEIADPVDMKLGMTRRNPCMTILRRQGQGYATGA
jgi:hypothetical protein